MKKKSSDRGSALLMAIVVVLIAAGVGSSFLVVNLISSKEQTIANDQDELMAMCDAGMERAKQALDIYRGYKPPGYVSPTASLEPWKWNDVLTYCWNNMGRPANFSEPPDLKLVKDDALAAMKTARFTTYPGQVSWTTAGALWGRNTQEAALTLPPDPINPNTADPANGTFIGWNVPFHKGAIHVYVHNNGESVIDPSSGLPMATSPTADNDRMICITVTATLPNGLQRQVEGMYRLPPIPPPSRGPQLAAVVSQDDVQTLGNVSIDGRDWNQDGTAVMGPGVFGILSTKDIDVGGSSAVGGSGNAPPRSGASAGSVQANGGSYFPDGYPDSPDKVLNLPRGELKNEAIRRGTYFTSEADYLRAMPPGGWSGTIVYAEFDPSPSFAIGGDAYNADPTILVIHNDTGTTSVKNTKGFFKGLLIADEINHTSAPGGLIGSEFLLSPTAASGANAFGTANTPIKFSSEVMNGLPAPNNANVTPSTLVSYRKVQ